ncbi:MAG: endonuclease III [Sphaerochaetaceae bacterium]
MENRIETIAGILDEQSPKEIRFLDERDPFRFLVSVVLSAQTTDEAVNKVVPLLFSRYKDACSLARAEQQDIEEIIHRLGFYHAKAKNIIALASSLCDMPFPTTLENLVKLPGVGRKTANCYIGDILGKSAVIVDTHFKRVVQRLGLVTTSNPTVIEAEIKKQLAPEKQYRFSMTVNLHGRRCCHAKNPDCPSCPLASLCPSSVSFAKDISK